jgi:hypothetical protein
LSASESAAAPASPIWFTIRLLRGDRVRDARGETGRRHRAGLATYTRDVSLALLLSASESAAAPASPLLLLARLQRKRKVRDARDETGPPARSRARATNLSDLSVALRLSASESAAAPASPILLPYRLQRGEEGQRSSLRDRAVGTEPGARDLLERRQQAQCIRNLVTIPPDR